MSTYKELIKIVADLAKQVSDDDTLTDRHIAFLLKKYRSYLLKQKYNNAIGEVPISNYQTVCSKLVESQSSSLSNCCGNSCYGTTRGFTILRSESEVTFPLTFSDTKVSLIRCAGLFSIGFDANLAYPNPNQGKFETQEEYDNFLSYITQLTSVEEIYIDNIISEGSNLSTAVENPYQTSCKDDAATIISMITAKYPDVEKLLSVVKTTTPQECNPDNVYDAAMRSFGNVVMVSRERFGYVGISKYSGKNVYGTIGLDGKLYIKAKEDISIYNKAFVTSIFEDPEKAQEQSSCTYKVGDVIKNCPDITNGCDPWENTFPIEDSLQSQLINLVLKDILGAAYRPADTINNQSDDLSDIIAYVRRNMKQQYVNQQAPSDGTAE